MQSLLLLLNKYTWSSINIKTFYRFHQVKHHFCDRLCYAKLYIKYSFLLVQTWYGAPLRPYYYFVIYCSAKKHKGYFFKNVTSGIFINIHIFLTHFNPLPPKNTKKLYDIPIFGGLNGLNLWNEECSECFHKDCSRDKQRQPC